MTILEITNSKGERKYFEGFGTYKTASEWARTLNLPRMTVWRYLQQGMTPEEIQVKCGIKEVKLADSPRKKRIGHRQKDTFERVEELLDFSGYNPDELEVATTSGAFRHLIVWNGKMLGKYDPARDLLWLTGGDTIALVKPRVPNMKIHHINGFWFITPETKQALVTVFVNHNTK